MNRRDKRRARKRDRQRRCPECQSRRVQVLSDEQGVYAMKCHRTRCGARTNLREVRHG